MHSGTPGDEMGGARTSGEQLSSSMDCVLEPPPPPGRFEQRPPHGEQDPGDGAGAPGPEVDGVMTFWVKVRS